MFSKVTLSVVALCLSGAPTSAQQLDDAAVANAIKAGEENKFRPWIFECKAGLGFKDRLSASADRSFGGMNVQPIGRSKVVLSASLGRIAFLAAEGKRLKKPFGVADVTEGLRNPAVYAFVDPDKPPSQDWGGGIPIPSPIDKVVIRSSDDPTSVAEAGTLGTEDVKWDDRTEIVFGIGADGRPEKRPLVVERSRATAVFALDAIRDLRAGDLDLVVITQAGERHCTMPVRDRLRLFP
jgi:hypothetical protein